MFASNSKNFECKKEIKKELDYEKRLCNIYGLCVSEMTDCRAHEVTNFGLRKLNEY